MESHLGHRRWCAGPSIPKNPPPPPEPPMTPDPPDPETLPEPRPPHPDMTCWSRDGYYIVTWYDQGGRSVFTLTYLFVCMFWCVVMWDFTVVIFRNDQILGNVFLLRESQLYTSQGLCWFPCLSGNCNCVFFWHLAKKSLWTTSPRSRDITFLSGHFMWFWPSCFWTCFLFEHTRLLSDISDNSEQTFGEKSRVQAKSSLLQQFWSHLKTCHKTFLLIALYSLKNFLLCRRGDEAACRHRYDLEMTRYTCTNPESVFHPDLRWDLQGNPESDTKQNGENSLETPFHRAVVLVHVLQFPFFLSVSGTFQLVYKSTCDQLNPPACVLKLLGRVCECLQFCEDSRGPSNSQNGLGKSRHS